MNIKILPQVFGLFVFEEIKHHVKDPVPYNLFSTVIPNPHVPSQGGITGSVCKYTTNTIARYLRICKYEAKVWK